MAHYTFQNLGTDNPSRANHTDQQIIYPQDRKTIGKNYPDICMFDSPSPQKRTDKKDEGDDQEITDER
jgi:hypothetical protein